MTHPNDAVTAAMALENDRRTAYPFIEARAKSILDMMAPEAPRMSTWDLVNAIYDPDGPVDEKARMRVFKALSACAAHGLVSYVVLGPPERVGNVANARRKNWGAPVKSSPYVCAMCKRPL